jgi:hypothetical protein
MSILVPTKGLSGYLDVTLGGVTHFLGLGPFPAGSILRRVSTTVTMSGEAGGPELKFQIAVVSSADLNRGVFAAGVPLLEYANKVLDGVPCVVVDAVQSLAARYEWFPGWEFQTGSQWVLVAASLVATASYANLFVSCEVQRVVRRLEELVGRGGVT